MSITRENYVAGLRAAADFYEQHENITLPSTHSADVSNFQLSSKEEAVTVAKALGACRKSYFSSLFTIKKEVAQLLSLVRLQPLGGMRARGYREARHSCPRRAREGSSRRGHRGSGMALRAAACRDRSGNRGDTVSHDTKKTYLGDGVYARHEDSDAIVLTAEDGIAIRDEIHLEFEVYSALVAYACRVWPGEPS